MNRLAPSSATVLLLALSVALASCGSGSTSDAADTAVDQHVINYDSADVRLASAKDTIRLRALLAMTAEQKTMGLMERRHLPDETGMLFVYDSTQPADAGFWMFRTRIPLDIAFLDSTGAVRTILAMTPCTAVLAQGCPTYAPNVAYRYALEVNKGYFARHGLDTGSRLVLADIPASRPRR
jgi:uncharacterized membrane protein (UPF0127 family)